MISAAFPSNREIFLIAVSTPEMNRADDHTPFSIKREDEGKAHNVNMWLRWNKVRQSYFPSRKGDCRQSLSNTLPAYLPYTRRPCFAASFVDCLAVIEMLVSAECHQKNLCLDTRLPLRTLTSNVKRYSEIA